MTTTPTSRTTSKKLSKVRIPDRLFFRIGDVAELLEKQSRILAAAARLPRVGGRLVYATCSVLREEGEDIVAKFLAAHTGYGQVSCAEILAAQGISLDTGMNLRVYPHVHGTDGFFAAAFERKS